MKNLLRLSVVLCMCFTFKAFAQIDELQSTLADINTRYEALESELAALEIEGSSLIGNGNYNEQTLRQIDLLQTKVIAFKSKLNALMHVRQAMFVALAAQQEANETTEELLFEDDEKSPLKTTQKKKESTQLSEDQQAVQDLFRQAGYDLTFGENPEQDKAFMEGFMEMMAITQGVETANTQGDLLFFDDVDYAAEARLNAQQDQAQRSRASRQESRVQQASSDEVRRAEENRAAFQAGMQQLYAGLAATQANMAEYNQQHNAWVAQQNQKMNNVQQNLNAAYAQRYQQAQLHTNNGAAGYPMLDVMAQKYGIQKTSGSAGVANAAVAGSASAATINGSGTPSKSSAKALSACNASSERWYVYDGEAVTSRNPFEKTGKVRYRAANTVIAVTPCINSNGVKLISKTSYKGKTVYASEHSVNILKKIENNGYLVRFSRSMHLRPTDLSVESLNQDGYQGFYKNP